MKCERCENLWKKRSKKPVKGLLQGIEFSEQPGQPIVINNITYSSLCAKCINEWAHCKRTQHQDFFKREQFNITERYGLELMSHNVTINFERGQKAKQDQLDLGWEIRPKFLNWLHTKPQHIE